MTVSIDAGAHRTLVLARRDALIAQTMPAGRMPLVERIAREVKRRLGPSFALDDLIGAGQVGLVIAAQLYRPERGEWQAFARLKIHGAISDATRRGNYTANTMPPIADDFDGATADNAAACDRMDAARVEARLALAVGALPAAERRVVRRYYEADKPSDRATGKVLSISRWQAQRLRHAALARLRERLTAA